MFAFKRVFEGSIKEFKFLLPIFFLSVVVAVLIERFIPSDFIFAILGDNLFIAIPLAAFIGVVLPIPRYATYPIAFALFTKGASIGVIFALIAGEVICENIIGDVMEAKFFGLKYFTVRLLLSIVFISIGGFVIEVLL
jgi:uncharacterized membrane protein YraQ (UPF0718 family)